MLTGALATPATQASNVGSYAITQGTLASNPNYTISFTSNTLTITPAPLTVTANDATRQEGQPNPPFSATLGGFRLGESPGVLGGALAFNTPATPASAPGAYAITPFGLTATNYVITFVDGVLTVTVAPPSPPTPGTPGAPGAGADGSVQAQRPPLSTPTAFIADRFTTNVSLGAAGSGAQSPAALQQIAPAAGPATPAALQQIAPGAGPGTPASDTGACGEAIGDTLGNTWLENFIPGAPSAIAASVAACRQSLGPTPPQQ